MTLLELIRESAKKYNRTITDDEAINILWSYTGYPCFWRDPTNPEACLREQLDEFFANPKKVIQEQEQELRELCRTNPPENK